VDRLHAQTYARAQESFPGDHAGPRKWLALITGLLDTAAAYIAESQQPGKSAAETLSLVNDASQIAHLAYQLLNLMGGAGLDELPYCIVAPLQRWFDDLGIDNSTFFRAELVINYELRPFDQGTFKGIRNPTQSLSLAINEITWPLLRVTVPSKAFGIIPHFAIVAHELGHALAEKIVWDQTKFASFSTDLVNRISSRLNMSPLTPSVLKKGQEVFLSWTAELTADAFCFFIAGPAAFFSLSELLAIVGGDGLTQTHPAAALRRQTLFDRMSMGSTSFSDLFYKHTGQVLSTEFVSSTIKAPPPADQLFVQVVQNTKDSELAAVLTEMNEALPSTISAIYEHVESFLKANYPSSIYTPGQFDADLNTHLQALLSAIPPIESGITLKERKATTFTCIINVGWCALLTKLSDLRVKIEGPDPLNTKKLECLHSLLLKSVELSEVRRTWETV